MKDDQQQEIYERIGQCVRDAREAAHMTQGELSERIGLTRASVTNIETARQKVQLHTLYAIAHTLEVPLATLLPPSEAATPNTSPRVLKALQNAKDLRPTDRQVLETLLSNALPLGATIHRPGRMIRSRKTP